MALKMILALETSSAGLGVALGTAAGKIREIRSGVRFRHSENLIALVERLLKKEKLSLEDIDCFAIDRGPGSFTGLRIGFSFLKGFLAVRKRPCYGALSLDMIAAGIDLPEGSRLGVLVDARRERIYSRFYHRRKGEWVAERRLELLALSGLVDRITAKTALVGDALLRYQKPLENKLGKQIHLLRENLSHPSAATLVRWFQERNQFLVPLRLPKDFLPLYFRRSEAEEKRRERRRHAH